MDRQIYNDNFFNFSKQLINHISTVITNKQNDEKNLDLFR